VLNFSLTDILRSLGQTTQGYSIKVFPQRYRSTHRKTPNPSPPIDSEFRPLGNPQNESRSTLAGINPIETFFAKLKHWLRNAA
jgi:hypothetical protein